MRIHIKTNNILHSLFGAALFFYMVSAIAFECTPETSFISSAAIYLVFLLGVLTIIFERKVSINPYVLCTLALCLYAFLMIMSPDASRSMGASVAYWILTCTILSVIVFYNITFSPKIVDLMIWANIIGAIVLAVRIIGAYGGLAAMLELASTEGEENRIGSMILNANTVGLCMGNAAICCMYQILKEKKQSKIFQCTVAVLAVLCAVMCFLTGSKKSVVFIILGVVAMLVFYSRNISLRKKIALLLLAVLLIAGIVVAIQSLPMFSTLNMRFEELFDTMLGQGEGSKSDRIRFEMIDRGWTAFLESPLVGKGTGHSYLLFGTYSHNNFIELLMSYGAVGFLLYYSLYIPLFFLLARQIKKGDMKAVYFLTFMLLQILLGVGWVNYYERTVQIMVAGAWGYVISRSKNKTRSSTYEIA